MPNILYENGAPQTSTAYTTQDLTAPVTFHYDKIFETLIDNIAPQRIMSKNKLLLESFVDILGEVSPISVNIIDVFNKNRQYKEHSHIKGVQDGFAQMFLENFWSVVHKAQNNYALQNRLNNILAKYTELAGATDALQSELVFFGNTDELYTEERYILGKDFKEKKGTGTAIEYAYKVGWLAEIEGPLRDSYYFKLHTPECTGGIPKGIIIACENPYTPSPEAPSPDQNGDTWAAHPACTGVPYPNERFINEFYIGEELDDNDCRPFSYSVEGSMIPALFEAFVIPLAHPVGFSYSYKKVLIIDFIDYFNLEYIYTANKVSVKSLCPNGDCAVPEEDIYGLRGGGGITNSELKYYETGDIYVGDFKGWSYDKYTFANGSYLVSFKYVSPRGVNQEVIHYYDIADIEASQNIIKNGDFDDNSEWNLGSNWSIVNGKAVNSGGGVDDKLSQSVVLEANKTYNLRITATLDSSNDNFIIDVGGVIINILSTGTTNTSVVIGDSNSGEFSIYGNNKTFSIDDISLVKIEPTTVYNDYTHSSIIIDNPTPPVAVLYTHDIFSYSQDFAIGDHITIPIFDDDRTNLPCHNIVVNPKFTIDASTIINNGDFLEPIGTYWTAVGNWQQHIDPVYHGVYGYMTLTNGTITDTLSQNLYWEDKEYEIYGTLKPSSYDDYLVITIGSSVYEINNYGRFTIQHTGNSSDTNVVLAGKNDIKGTANLRLDEFQIREIDDKGLYGWNAGANWKVINNRATLTNGDSSDILSQSIMLDGGVTYRINFDVEVNSSTQRAFFQIGNEKHKIGGIAKERYTFTPPTSGNYLIQFYPEANNTTFSVTNIEVDCNKDIIGDAMTSLYTNKLAVIGPDLLIADARLDVGVNVTREGGFIIGGYILPHGDPSTQYMLDNLSISPEQQVWKEALDVPDFRDPSEWSTDTSWTIITGSTPTGNYAYCDGTQSGYAKLYRTFTINDSSSANSHYVRVDFDMSTQSINGYIKVYSGITDGVLGVDDEIRFYGSGLKSFIMKYDHSLEGNGENKIIFYASNDSHPDQEAFEGTINSVQATYIEQM